MGIVDDIIDEDGFATVLMDVLSDNYGDEEEIISAWENDHTQVFNMVKQALTTKPVEVKEDKVEQKSKDIYTLHCILVGPRVRLLGVEANIKSFAVNNDVEFNLLSDDKGLWWRTIEFELSGDKETIVWMEGILDKINN